MTQVSWQYEESTVDAYTDSDWAGCLRTRRSTSGGLLMLGTHVLRTWSVTQAVVATSSGEAELYSMAEGASRGLGFRTALCEMGMQARLVVLTDSSAAKAFASTRGLGRIRHLEVKDLWLQGLVKDGRVNLEKVQGDRNPADVLTKYHDKVALRKTLQLAGIEVVLAGGPDQAEGGCSTHSLAFGIQGTVRDSHSSSSTPRGSDHPPEDPLLGGSKVY